MEAILKREIVTNKTICRIFAAFTFVILTALGAYVRIPLPFTPVPITLQTFFVLLGAALLGRGLGVITQAAYLTFGIAGLSIFTGAGYGFAYLLGPTGGYLLGFVLAAYFGGKCLDSERGGLLYVFAVLFAADLILLACGVLWLKAAFGLSLAKAILLGLLPFIPGDILKALAAAHIYLRLKPRLEKVL